MKLMGKEKLIERDTTRDLNQELLSDLQTLKKSGTRKLKIYIVGSSEIIAARNALKMTQSQFAGLLKVSVRTLQDWEQGRRQPKGPAQSLIKVAIARPDVLREIFPV